MFEKLILEETAAQLLRGGDDGQVSLSLLGVTARADALPDGSRALLLTLEAGKSEAFSENDVVLLSKEDPQREDATDELRHALGVVERREGTQSVRVRVRPPTGSRALSSPRQKARREAMLPLLGLEGQAWWVLRLSNSSTIQREWAAVRGAGSIPKPLLKAILGPPPEKAAGGESNADEAGVKKKKTTSTKKDGEEDAGDAMDEDAARVDAESVATEAQTALSSGADAGALVPPSAAAAAASPPPSSSLALAPSTPPRTMDVSPALEHSLRTTYNASQLSAILTALQDVPLTLIQGPPGTGKTRTILALLSVLLQARLGGWKDQAKQICEEGTERSVNGVNGGEDGKGEKNANKGGDANGDKLAQPKTPPLSPSSSSSSPNVPLLTPEQRIRLALWRRSSPWLGRAADPRSRVLPPDLADASSAFGMTRGSAPLRVAARAGVRTRVLVCAPSNSALDELVLRIISAGLVDREGGAFTPDVVRVGVNIHRSVQAVSLEVLVDRRLAAGGGVGAAGGGGSAGGELGRGGGRSVDALDAHEAVDGPSASGVFAATSSGIGGGSSAGSSGSGTRSGSGSGRNERDRVRAAILDSASIVCTTLAFAGSSSFSRLASSFDAVVVDEAAQAVEPSLLVPLVASRARRAFLVGDPEQLPATVLSRRALRHGYATSAFRRLRDAGVPVLRLTVQYRMHPSIREFPSRLFYNDSLEDGPDALAETARPWHAALPPVAVVDVAGGREGAPEGSSSLANETEARAALALLRALARAAPDTIGTPGGTSRVGIVSPYRAQVALLRSIAERSLAPDAAAALDVNSVDGFQGREKDVVLLSTVRSGRHGAIGFVADERRANVALTRARSSVVVLCNAHALCKDPVWGALLEHASQRDGLFRLAPGADPATFAADLIAGRVRPLSLAAALEMDANKQHTKRRGEEDEEERGGRTASGEKKTKTKRGAPQRNGRNQGSAANAPSAARGGAEDDDPDLYSDDDDDNGFLAKSTVHYGAKVKKHLQHNAK